MEAALKIDQFKGKYIFLSNFYSAPVWMDGKMYSTVEHAYQAAKTMDNLERDIIACAVTPGKAKQLGNNVRVLRPNWDNVKEAIMLDLLLKKFVPFNNLAINLMDTYPYQLIEGNDWNDYYWGVCNKRGKNRLGELLMEVRTNLRDMDRSLSFTGYDRKL